MQQRNGGFWLFLLMGPYAFFATFFSFAIPPIGFLMAYRGYRKDKAAGERYVGWIVLMTISAFISIILIAVLISMAFMPQDIPQE